MKTKPVKQMKWLFVAGLGLAVPSFADTAADSAKGNSESLSFSVELEARPSATKGVEFPSGRGPRLLGKKDLDRAILAAKKRAPVTEALSRDVASSDWAGQQSAEYRAFRDRFESVKNPDELHWLLGELEARYDKHPTDLKLVTIAMSGLRTYRGIVYRFGPLFDNVKFAKAQAMTSIGRFFRALNIQLPYEHVKVVQLYLQEPSAQELNRRFNEEDNARVFLVNEVLRNHEVSVARIEKLSLEVPPVVDGSLMLGLGRQAPGTARFAFGEAQRQNLLAALRSEMAGLAVLAAYSVVGKIDVHYDLMKALHSDSTRSAPYVAGLTTEDVVSVFRKDRYKNYLTLLPKSGVTWMRRARVEAQKSVEHSILYWNEVKTYAGSQIPQYDPAGLNNQVAQLDSQLQTLSALLEGRTVLRDAVTGEMVEVNMDAYFENPPSDRKVFFPTVFRTPDANRTRVGKVGMGRKATEYRIPDFSIGEPIGWDLKLWQRYFPRVKSQEDLQVAFRVVSQNWGNLFPAFIFVTPLPLLL